MANLALLNTDPTSYAKQRTLTLLWKVRTEGAVTILLTLTAMHNPDRKQLFSTFRSETETDYGTYKARGFMVFEGLTLTTRPVARYSDKALASFLDEALNVLRATADAGPDADPTVIAMHDRLVAIVDKAESESVSV